MITNEIFYLCKKENLLIRTFAANEKAETHLHVSIHRMTTPNNWESVDSACGFLPTDVNSDDTFKQLMTSMGMNESTIEEFLDTSPEEMMDKEEYFSIIDAV